MIVTDLEHMAEQLPANAAMKKAVDFLKKAKGQDFADGRVEIDGDTVYALVQSYDTVPAGDPVRFEAHKKYIDVQYVASGEEVIGWAPTAGMTETVAYNASNDAWLGTVPAQSMTPVRLSAGQGAILYPSDGHAPRLMAGKPSKVKKFVIKVAV
jgi:biofilm protein TabA